METSHNRSGCTSRRLWLAIAMCCLPIAGMLGSMTLQAGRPLAATGVQPNSEGRPPMVNSEGRLVGASASGDPLLTIIP